MSFSWAKPYEPKHPFMRWLDERLPLPRLVYGAIGGGYPVPRNLNYWWNFGVLAGLFLTIQIVTGIVLAMWYYASADGAFNSVEHIMRDVNAGWLLRYAHMNGASFFFIVTYIHIFRGLYYGSYKAPRELVWMLGLVIYLLMMATAFMGYVLPWGQMSYWGAQVITGFFSAFPLVGEPIRIWLLGGYAPDQAALTRFFSLHYLLPFVIAGGRDPAHLGAAHPGLEQPDRRRREGREGHAAVPPVLHGEGRLVRRGVPAGLSRWSSTSRRTISGTRTITFRPTRWRRRRTSCPNGISGRSTRSFAPSRWTSSCRRSCGACWRCSARSCCCSSCRGSTSRRSARASYRPVFKRFFWLLVVDVLILGYVGGAAINAVQRRARPARGGLLFPPLPRHPAAGLGVRDAASAAELDQLVACFTARQKEAAPAGQTTPRRSRNGNGRLRGQASNMLRFILGFIGAVFAGGPADLAASAASRPISATRPRRRPRRSSTSIRSTCTLASDGPFGKFDKQQLQRGFQVYTEVCSACHSLNLVAFRDLEALGYNEAEVKKIAVQTGRPQVPSINPDTGEAGDAQGAAVRPLPVAVRRTRLRRARRTTMRFRRTCR